MKPETFIADLYECRAKMVKPIPKGQMQDMQEMLQYNWMNVIIANLSDKYKVKYQEIDEEIKSRVTTHGYPLHHCAPGCPNYSSGHSIDASGNCNMGCC